MDPFKKKIITVLQINAQLLPQLAQSLLLHSVRTTFLQIFKLSKLSLLMVMNLFKFTQLRTLLIQYSDQWDSGTDAAFKCFQIMQRYCDKPEAPEAYFCQVQHSDH